MNYPYFMDVDQVVEFSGLSKEDIYEAIESEDLKFALIHNRIRVTRGALDDFFKVLRENQRSDVNHHYEFVMDAVYTERVADALAEIASKVSYSSPELREHFIADILRKPIQRRHTGSHVYDSPEDRAQELYQEWLQSIATAYAERGKRNE